MLNFKEKIAEEISKVTNLNKEELENYIEVPKDSAMGDYAFPCFKLAKELRKAPPAIAAEIYEKLEMDEETFELFVRYQMSVAERMDLMGASAHTVDILRVS